MRIWYRVNTANGAVDLTEDVSGGLAAHKSRIEGIYGDRLVRFGVLNPESKPAGPRGPSAPGPTGPTAPSSSGFGDGDFAFWMLGIVFVLMVLVNWFFMLLFDPDKGQDLETDLRIAGDLRERCSSCSSCSSGYCCLFDLELVAPGESVCSSYN